MKIIKLYIETGYFPQSDISFEVAIGNWEKIKTLKMPGEEDIRIFKELFSQIYYLAEQGDRKAIETVCTDCENINWFYNWIIDNVWEEADELLGFNVHNGSRFSGTIETIQELEPDALVITDGFTISERDVPDAKPEVNEWLERLGY